jgi:hypothetical protein
MAAAKVTMEEQRDLFGGSFFDEPAGGPQNGWGQDGEQTQRRMSERTKKDWTRIQAEVEESNAGFASLMDAGLPPGSTRAMDLAEQHRLHMRRWFSEISTEQHRGLGDRYVTDPQFSKNYESVRAGMAQFVRDAIHANADRAPR